MEQMKSMNALAPFLALTKTANSPRAAANLIESATSASNTFIFAELLQAPNIQALSSSSEFSSHLSLLKIFSYGTYSDYISSTSLPPLNPAQMLKLRQLSLLTLAKNQADLTYANLLSHLGLETLREVEDLVISAIYAGLVSATLDPYHQLVAVTSVSPLRDLQPDSIPAMLSTLNEWSTRCVSTLADLEKQIAGIKAEAMKRHREETEWNAQVEKLLEVKAEVSFSSEEKEKDVKKLSFSAVGKKLGFGAAAKRGNGAVAGDGEVNDMDVDEDDEGSKVGRDTRSSKKRGHGGK
ncbi:related to ACOB protein [Rhynchosporium agropyri]|uniref:Related to ACOB protein n=1 Tax=Rhynchosporium agropyri TaxID=914238 RepID=A0A1E1KME0_9HELO|nr:related to ACOB protein [Rhynchosporium agropyri]